MFVSGGNFTDETLVKPKLLCVDVFIGLSLHLYGAIFKDQIQLVLGHIGKALLAASDPSDLPVIQVEDTCSDNLKFNKFNSQQLSC